MNKIINVYIFPIFFFWVSFFASAQNAESDVELLVKKTQNLYAATDSTGNYVFVFQNTKQYEVVFFDKQNKKIADYVLPIPPQISRDEFLGTQFLGDSCYTYYFNERSRMVTQISIAKNTGQLSKKIVGQLAYSAKLFKSFPLNDKFYLLTVTHGKNEIESHAISNGNLTTTTYQVEMPDLYKRLSSGNGLLNEESGGVLDIDRINYKIENNVKSARATKKIYAFGANIYLLFDDPDYTHVLHINVATNTCTYKQFLFTLEKGNALRKQGNSFLLGDKLFRVTLNPDQLSFTVLNIESNKTYTTFYATPHNAINFKNGAIIQENSSDKQKVVEDPETFFKKVLASNLSVSVNIKDSVYIVEIGSYEEFVSGGYGNNGMNGGSGPTFSMGMGMGGMGMGMGSGGMGMGMGGMGMGYGGMGGMYDPYGYRYPGYYNGYNGYYNSSTTTTIRTLYFHSMLDTATFKQEPGIIPISLRERVSNFETAMFKEKKPETIRIVDFDDRIIIGYLMASDNSFKTYSFYK